MQSSNEDYYNIIGNGDPVQGNELIQALIRKLKESREEKQFLANTAWEATAQIDYAAYDLRYHEEYEYKKNKREGVENTDILKEECINLIVNVIRLYNLEVKNR